MKYYNKFYEIGSNRYYTINIDDEYYIATESIVNIKEKKKQKELLQGFKLLKFSVPIASLFNMINEAKIVRDKYGYDDLVEYEIIDDKLLRKNIEKLYIDIFKEQKDYIDSWYKDSLNYLEEKQDKDLKFKKEQLKVQYDSMLIKLDYSNPIKNNTLNFDNKLCKNDIINYMLKNNIKYLYSECVKAFMKNTFLYTQDCFGTVIIYRIVTVKDVIKSIDTFIYDKKLIKELLKFLEEKENK